MIKFAKWSSRPFFKKARGLTARKGGKGRVPCRDRFFDVLIGVAFNDGLKKEASPWVGEGEDCAAMRGVNCGEFFSEFRQVYQFTENFDLVIFAAFDDEEVVLCFY